MEMDERIRHAFEQTEILKPPKQFLSTFGSSTVHYYLLTEPVYLEFERRGPETVIREGKITWGQPRILTPGYILKTEGFSGEARQAFEMLAREMPDLAGILYHWEFKKELEKMNIVSGNLREVFKKLEEEIDKKRELLCAIIKGIDELWDVSLSWFIYGMIRISAHEAQWSDFSKEGLIKPGKFGLPIVSKDRTGIPITARNEIEKMFELARKGELDPSKLKQELDRWGVFEEYEDRFFNLFRKRRW